MKPAISVSAAHQSWLDAFSRRHSRPLRVLHIGNIANNAYLNSKILNRVGVRSDVLCHNDYYCMACPEWEDADYEGDIVDAYYPAWEQVNLKGFRRPRWFAQGPLPLCVEYLTAKLQGRLLAAVFQWHRLRNAAQEFCAHARHERAPLSMPLSSPCAVANQACLAERIACGLIAQGRSLLDRLGVFPYRPVRQPVDPQEDLHAFEASIAELIERFQHELPEGTDKLARADFLALQDVFTGLRQLLALYDVVIGYSTDGIYPLLAGFRPYLTYEHGTIRNIPFEATSQGRLCALTYKCGDGCFITNCDNARAADRLGLQSYDYLPHAMNEACGVSPEPQGLRPALCARLRSSFLVFHPSRQHWSSRLDTKWEKGNDIFLRGFARSVRESCPDAAAVLVDWGQSVAESKNLIASLGIAHRVLWIPPQKLSALLAHMRACDVVADQFLVGVFGGITPKALMMGRPVVLRFDEELHQWCFNEMPPVLNAQTDDDVAAALARLYRDQAFAVDVGVRGAAWYQRYYSNQVVLDRMLHGIMQALGRTRYRQAA